MNTTTRGRPSVVARVLIVALSMLGATLAASSSTAPAAASTPQVVVNMPFTGKWAYNAHVNPPYTDANSSHPSVHAQYYGDWGTDLYADHGTPVQLNVTSPHGAVTFTKNRTNDTCSSYGAGIAGNGIVLNVLVDGAVVGTIDFEHLDNISAGPYGNGMTVGTITAEPLHSSCYTVRHLHIEMKNNTGNTFSCFVDKGSPGAELTAGVPIGVLGSSNTGTRQACASVPAAAPVTPRVAFLYNGNLYVKEGTDYSGSTPVIAGGVTGVELSPNRLAYYQSNQLWVRQGSETVPVANSLTDFDVSDNKIAYVHNGNLYVKNGTNLDATGVLTVAGGVTGVELSPNRLAYYQSNQLWVRQGSETRHVAGALQEFDVTDVKIAIRNNGNLYVKDGTGLAATATLIATGVTNSALN